MNNLTISVFENQIFLEILKELKFFSRYNIKFYSDINYFVENYIQKNQLVVFFANDSNKKKLKKLNEFNLPIIIIGGKSVSEKGKFITENIENIEKIDMPFSILNFKKKIISLLAKHEFNKSSLINLGDYLIDKNERKIKKNKIELQLTEKEINFLILFSKSSKPIKKSFFLKNVWNYSQESDTHTIETHIHRLRKKIFEKFKDSNFIKNSDKGYYI